MSHVQKASRKYKKIAVEPVASRFSKNQKRKSSGHTRCGCGGYRRIKRKN